MKSLSFSNWLVFLAFFVHLCNAGLNTAPILCINCRHYLISAVPFQLHPILYWTIVIIVIIYCLNILQSTWKSNCSIVSLSWIYEGNCVALFTNSQGNRVIKIYFSFCSTTNQLFLDISRIYTNKRADERWTNLSAFWNLVFLSFVNFFLKHLFSSSTSSVVATRRR